MAFQYGASDSLIAGRASFPGLWCFSRQHHLSFDVKLVWLNYKVLETMYIRFRNGCKHHNLTQNSVEMCRSTWCIFRRLLCHTNLLKPFCHMIKLMYNVITVGYLLFSIFALTIINFINWQIFSVLTSNALSMSIVVSLFFRLFGLVKEM